MWYEELFRCHFEECCHSHSVTQLWCRVGPVGVLYYYQGYKLCSFQGVIECWSIKREEQSQCFVIVPIPPFELVSLWLGIAWVPYGSVLSMSDQLFRIPYKLNITKKRHRILIQWPYRLKANLAYNECFVIICYTLELRRVGRALYYILITIVMVRAMHSGYSREKCLAQL